MTGKTRDIILKALSTYRGDDYERALSAWRGATKAVMDGEYGASGKTRQQLLDAYKVHVDAVEAAITEVRALP